MDDRTAFLDGETLVEALRLGGWMLAHQALTAARGETPVPLVGLAHDDLASPELIAPTTDSEFYDDLVIVGRILIADMCSEVRHWAFAYDKDLEDSGRALIVEVGVGEPRHGITFGQRYTYGNEAGLRLIGDLELVGQELLPSVVQERLESFRWRYLLTEGAMDHDLAGQQWPAWYSARDHEQVHLQLGEFSFAIPEGWLFRQTQDGWGWLISRLLPWEYREFEPTIIAKFVVYPDQATLEDVVEGRKAELLDEGCEVLKAEVSQILPSLPLLMAGRLISDEEREGRSFRAERVWVPTDVPGQFFVLWVASFNMESWKYVAHAFDAVLTSLKVSKKGSTESQRVDEDSKS